MTARHWMQIAALTSALGLTCTAAAHDSDRTTGTDDRSSVATYGIETPSSGAIVTPEDKASRLNEGNEQAGNRRGDVNDDTWAPNEAPSNDDAVSVNPGPSNDDMSVNPGPSTDDASSINPDRDADSARVSRPNDEGEGVLPQTGMRPSDMGPGSVRGE